MRLSRHLIVAIVVSLVSLPMISTRRTGRKFSGGLSKRGNFRESSRQVPKPNLRILVKPPKELCLIKSEDAFLECQAGGTPSALIHWLKDGRVIPQSLQSRQNDDSTDTNGFQKLDISTVVSRLYLDSVSEDDACEYTCVAETLYNRVTATTLVNVTSDGSPEESRTNTEPNRTSRIYQWTKTMVENINSDAKLICQATGQPQPTIRWLGPHDQELNAGKYEVLPSGSLIIHDLKWSDMGNYACIATNEHGSDRANTFLYPAARDEET